MVLGRHVACALRLLWSKSLSFIEPLGSGCGCNYSDGLVGSFDYPMVWMVDGFGLFGLHDFGGWP